VNRDRATILREMKLGDDTVDALKTTSLGSAREQDALIFLNRGAPEGEHTPIVKQLVADAIAGKDVSAVAARHGVSLPRDDIGADSQTEAARLRACVENLLAEKRRLEIRIAGLESEIEELKATAGQGALADESPEEYWRRSLTVLADEVIARPAYYWPDNWKKFKASSSLLDHATRAMTTWCDLVRQLSTQVALPDDGLGIPGFLDRSKQTGATT
jgi:hypothetical protein